MELVRAARLCPREIVSCVILVLVYRNIESERAIVTESIQASPRILGSSGNGAMASLQLHIIIGHRESQETL